MVEGFSLAKKLSTLVSGWDLKLRFSISSGLKILATLLPSRSPPTPKTGKMISPAGTWRCTSSSSWSASQRRWREWDPSSSSSSAEEATTAITDSRSLTLLKPHSATPTLNAEVDFLATDRSDHEKVTVALTFTEKVAL